MADIVAIIKDGLGFGDNSNKTSNIKSINDYIQSNQDFKINNTLDEVQLSDYIEINPSAKIGVTTETKVITDFISSDETAIKALPNVPNVVDRIELIDENDILVNNLVIHKNYNDYISLEGEASERVSLNILSPINNEEFTHRDGVLFSAKAIKDGINIPVEKIKWSSSIDGKIKDGNNFSYNRLSVGEHIIRLYIDGEISNIEIKLKIKRNSKADRPENLTEV